MSDFKAFLTKYASEANAIGQALVSVAAGVALPPAESTVVKGAADMLLNAATNILTGIDTVSEEVNIAEQDIENALNKVVPTQLQPLVDAAYAALETKINTLIDSKLPTDQQLSASINAAVTAQLPALVTANMTPGAGSESVIKNATIDGANDVTKSA